MDYRTAMSLEPEKVASSRDLCQAYSALVEKLNQDLEIERPSKGALQQIPEILRQIRELGHCRLRFPAYFNENESALLAAQRRALGYLERHQYFTREDSQNVASLFAEVLTVNDPKLRAKVARNIELAAKTPCAF